MLQARSRMKTLVKTAISAAFVCALAQACSAESESQTPPSQADERSEQSAKREFDGVDVQATFDRTKTRISAVVSDKTTGEDVLTLDWDTEAKDLVWRQPNDTASHAIEDARADLEPSLAQAIEIAHEQWAMLAQSAGGEVPYYDPGPCGGVLICAETCMISVGIWVCRQEVTCSTVENCTPDGCTSDQQCTTTMNCQWEWQSVQECCRWECWA